MERLDVEDGVSVHEHRSGLKLLEQRRSTMTLANREPYACPVCGEAFDRLLVAEDGALSLDDGMPEPVCLLGTGDELLVLTH